MSMLVGYKLTALNGEEIRNWGGVWGQTPGKPDMISLPNGDIVYGAEIGVEYGGCILTEWFMDEPPPAVPVSVSPRQVRLLLLQQGLLQQVTDMIAQQDEATKITWEYALEFRRDDPLLNQLSVNLNLSQEQIDQFFLAASQL